MSALKVATIGKLACVSKSLSNVFQQVGKQLDDGLKEDSVIANFLGSAETKTGFKKFNILVFFSIILALYLVLGYNSDFVCNFIGFAFPAYKSIKAIDSENPKNDTRWLVYWVVYSSFILTEYFAYYFLSWFIFYWFCKCLFLIFCMFPEPLNGSMIIYNNVIRPLFLRQGAAVDVERQSITRVAEEVLEKARKLMSGRLTDAQSFTYSSSIKYFKNK